MTIMLGGALIVSVVAGCLVATRQSAQRIPRAATCVLVVLVGSATLPACGGRSAADIAADTEAMCNVSNRVTIKRDAFVPTVRSATIGEYIDWAEEINKLQADMADLAPPELAGQLSRLVQLSEELIDLLGRARSDYGYVYMFELGDLVESAGFRDIFSLPFVLEGDESMFTELSDLNESVWDGAARLC